MRNEQFAGFDSLEEMEQFCAEFENGTWAMEDKPVVRSGPFKLENTTRRESFVFTNGQVEQVEKLVHVLGCKSRSDLYRKVIGEFLERQSA